MRSCGEEKNKYSINYCKTTSSSSTKPWTQQAMTERYVSIIVHWGLSFLFWLQFGFSVMTSLSPAA